MPKLLLLPGDGIGPEITDEVRRVAERITNDLSVDERPFGGASLDAHGVPLTDETLATAKASDAVLMGAVGGAVGASPWEKVPRNLRPEAGCWACAPACRCSRTCVPPSAMDRSPTPRASNGR
jgi:3-isopropylmalate dehydrogenase